MRNWKLFRAPKPPVQIIFDEVEGYTKPLGDPWGLGWNKPLISIPSLPDMLPFRKSPVAWLVSSLLLPLFVRAHYEETTINLVDYLPKSEEEMERILIAMQGIYNG